MTMHRRTLLKRTGAAAGVVALGAVPATNAVVAQDEVAIEFWDTLNADPRQTIVEDLGAAFQEANEGVTVEHRGWTTDELTDTLPRVVDSDQGPDIAQVNNGESLMGPMIRAEQLVDLSAYAEEYGWAESLPAGLLARNMYSADGTTFGSGQIWGMSAEAEIVGFYYRRSVFEEQGLAIPTTVAEFETLLGALREAGQEPLVFGNGDGWQAIHLIGEVLGTMTNREYLDGLIYRSGDQAFDDPTFVSAAAKVVEWQEAGYFLDGFEGVSGDEATALFTAGTGAILMQGSWAAGQVGETLGDDVGFFLMPPSDAAAAGATPEATPAASGGAVLHVGGVGIPYAITINAEDPDVAAAFIDTLISEDAFNAFIDAGLLPAGEVPADRIEEGTLAGDLYANWNTALQTDGLGHYLDWAAPAFYDELVSQLQSLLGAQATPEEVAANLQAFYAASFE